MANDAIGRRMVARAREGVGGNRSTRVISGRRPGTARQAAKGGACVGRLRCKTTSANDRTSGGPAGNTAAGRASAFAINSTRTAPTSSALGGFSNFAAPSAGTTRSDLQQTPPAGESGCCFPPASCEEQRVLAAFAGIPIDSARAQWFDKASHATSSRPTPKRRPGRSADVRFTGVTEREERRLFNQASGPGLYTASKDAASEFWKMCAGPPRTNIGPKSRRQAKSVDHRFPLAPSPTVFFQL